LAENPSHPLIKACADLKPSILKPSPRGLLTLNLTTPASDPYTLNPEPGTLNPKP